MYKILKTCTKCKDIKTIDMFYKDRKKIDGLCSHCKMCKQIANKKWIDNNPEKMKQSTNAWIERNKSRFLQKSRDYYYNHKEVALAKSKEYDKLNRATKRIYSLNYYKNNPDKMKNYHKKSYQRNKEKIIKRSNLRHVLKRKSSIISQKLNMIGEITYIYTLAKFLSKILTIRVSIDHIIPLKNKFICGLDVPWNMQLLELRDNISKNNKFDGTYNNSGWCNHVI
jgi:5-methylcytosine-specific restriction endonuclease McrA